MVDDYLNVIHDNDEYRGMVKGIGYESFKKAYSIYNRIKDEDSIWVNGKPFIISEGNLVQKIEGTEEIFEPKSIINEKSKWTVIFRG